MSTVIYCDGSYIPKIGMGCGVYIENSPLSYNAILFKPDEVRHTAPRAELLALSYALHAASQVTIPVAIFSDNKYTVDTFNTFYTNWAQTNFSKKEYKHLDIIHPMYAYFASQHGRITISHVFAHTGVVGNEYADRLAKQAGTLPPSTTSYITLQ